MADSHGIVDSVEELFEQMASTIWTPDITINEDFEEDPGEFGIWEPRRSKFVEDLTGARLRRRFCHDVIPVGDYQQGFDMVSQLANQRYYGQLLIISYHESAEWNHLHIVYDCGWTAGTCRCSIFQGVRFLRRKRRAQWSGELRGEYFRNLGIYMFLQPRICLYYFFAGARREVPGPNEIDSIEGSQEGGQGTNLDQDDEICAIRSDAVNGGEKSEFTTSTKGRKGKNCSSSKRQKGSKITQILQFFEKFPVCPLLSSCKTAQWIDNSELKRIGRTDSDYITAIDIFQRLICNKTINELIEFYLNSQPLFDCTSGHVYDYYYSVEESTSKLSELISYQCNYDEDYIKEFLSVVYNILDRKEEKKNCIQIRGPSNAGKTLFAKICASLCLVKGQIANFNKYSQFPLQDCVDKRILIWDEPNCEPSAYDTCKMLFAGDPCMANIKYQSHVQIDKTPVIVTTNAEVFPNNDIFNNRMYRFNWDNCTLLSNFTKHLHPLALYKLWKLYGIIKTIVVNE